MSTSTLSFRGKPCPRPLTKLKKYNKTKTPTTHRTTLNTLDKTVRVIKSKAVKFSHPKHV